MEEFISDDDRASFWLEHFAHLSPKFYMRVKYFEIGLIFDFEALQFRKEAMYLNLTQTRGAVASMRMKKMWKLQRVNE